MSKPIADPEQMQIFKKTLSRHKADRRSTLEVCFGVKLCLVGAVITVIHLRLFAVKCFMTVYLKKHYHTVMN